MNTVENIKSLMIGGAGISAVEVVEPIAHILPSDIQTGCQIVVQILIGIATLVGLFRKKK